MRHLASVTRSERVVVQDCYDLLPGDFPEHKRNDPLTAAHIILLLLSADFIYNDFCWKTMLQALQLCERGSACLIPILLRPFYYDEMAPFARFQMLPKEKAISRWNDLDEAYVQVVKGVNRVVIELHTKWEKEVGVEATALCLSEQNDQLVIPSSETINLLNIERRVLHNNDGK